MIARIDVPASGDESDETNEEDAAVIPTAHIYSAASGNEVDVTNTQEPGPSMSSRIDGPAGSVSCNVNLPQTDSSNSSNSLDQQEPSAESASRDSESPIFEYYSPFPSPPSLISPVPSTPSPPQSSEQRDSIPDTRPEGVLWPRCDDWYQEIEGHICPLENGHIPEDL